MVKDDVHLNFRKVIETLEEKGNKRTNVAKAIGYTTTTILNSVLNGNSILSTRAIAKLIEKFNINPVFIFLGKGDMFLLDDSGAEQIQEKIKVLENEKEEADKAIREYRDEIRRLVRRNDDLIDITATALKYYKKDEPLDGDPYDVTGLR